MNHLKSKWSLLYCLTIGGGCWDLLSSLICQSSYFMNSYVTRRISLAHTVSLLSSGNSVEHKLIVISSHPTFYVYDVCTIICVSGHSWKKAVPVMPFPLPSRNSPLSSLLESRWYPGRPMQSESLGSHKWWCKFQPYILPYACQNERWPHGWSCFCWRFWLCLL